MGTRFLYRDLSWLSFNGRGLDEAVKNKIPLINRLYESPQAAIPCSMKKTPGFWLLLLMVAIGCTQSKKTAGPSAYHLTKPIVFTMPVALDEISGIAFKNGNADTIYAEQDEEGKLFYFHLGDKEIYHTKFYKKGDYEDVATCNGYAVMLRSDGVFFTFPLNHIYNKEVASVNEQESLLPEGGYGSLYPGESTSTLYALCKNCKEDISNETGEGYNGTILQFLYKRK